jgi:hypothetical protein
MGQCVQGDERIITAGLENIDLATGGEHAANFLDRTRWLVEVVDHVAHDDVVEATIRERQGLCGRHNETGRGKARAGEYELLFEEIDAGCTRGLSQVRERRAFSAPQVQYSLPEG